MSNIPAELRYSEDHEWISTSAPWKIGVSDYAQNALGDLTYVELPWATPLRRVRSSARSNPPSP